MEQGVIQWYNHDKGYGYIKDGEDEFFVHYSAIKQDDLNEIKSGTKVSFQVSHNKRMVLAKQVSIYRPDEDNEGTDISDESTESERIESDSEDDTPDSSPRADNETANENNDESSRQK